MDSIMDVLEHNILDVVFTRDSGRSLKKMWGMYR